MRSERGNVVHATDWLRTRASLRNRHQGPSIRRSEDEANANPATENPAVPRCETEEPERGAAQRKRKLHDANHRDAARPGIPAYLLADMGRAAASDCPNRAGTERRLSGHPTRYALEPYEK